jgi:signal transduction histidine kinase/flagellar basal body-associated protein FliL
MRDRLRQGSSGRPSWSVRAYLVLIVVAACILLVVFGGISTVLGFQDAKDKALESAAMEAGLIAEDITTAITAARTTVAQTVASPALAQGLDAPAENCNLASGTSGIDLHLLVPSGEVFCSSVEGAGGRFSYADVDFEITGSTDGVGITEPFVDPVASDRAVAMTAPVTDESGAEAGSFVAVVHLDAFTQSLKTVTSARRSMEITLVHESSDEILSSSEVAGQGGRSVAGTAFEEVGRSAAEGLDGTSRLYGSALVGDAGWRVVVGLDEAEAMALARSALTRRIVFGLAMLALLLLIVSLIYRRIARPLRTLSRGIRNAGESPMPAPIEPDGPAEIVHLTEEFNAMLSARTQYEDRLVEAQKMEAVGQLAGGIAHDFNNLLSAVISYGHLLADQLAGDPRAEDAHQIVGAAERGTELVKRLLTFSRRESGEPRVVSIPTAVGEAAKLLRQMIREDIVLDFQLDPDCWNVLIDPVEFDQVLVNLVVNARDAMPKGGRITVAAANRTVEDTQQPGPPAGDYVILTVEDTGEGIDPAIRDRIFEPFFSTKPEERGSGLGLAVVYGVVKKAGGSLNVTSKQGEGTVFSIVLPRETRADVDPAGAAEDDDDTGEGTTILVVEDEDMVRDSTVRVLEKHHFNVLSTASGTEALRILVEQRGRIDLLLTDLVMPEMSGTALAAQAGVPVLFMSGYADSQLRNAGLTDLSHHIEKPFAPGDLVAAIRQVLAS